MAADILIVDDEVDIRELIGGILEDEGYETRLASDSDSALREIEERRPSLIVLDIWLQGSKLDGLELLEIIQQAHADVPVVIISGHGNIETAVSAIKNGAYDYIEKPFKADRLILVIGRALEAYRLKREINELRSRAGAETDLIGESQPMRQLRQALKRIAPSNGRVMITGPHGSGKELAARTLHAWSARSSGPFVILPAATMSPERVEEELFGIETDAGAVHRVGALEQAHGGTLYLDEVADMPLQTQGKILRVLVEQQFQRVNGNTKVKVDVRIVSSTSRSLEPLIEKEMFRSDFYHRLNVVPIDIPALAERREDIPELIEHFTRLYSAQSGQPLRCLSTEAVAVLQTYDWTGNVRQLRNNIERIMIMAGSDASTEIGADMLPKETEVNGSDDDEGWGSERVMALPLREAREVFERDYLAAQLSRFGGNISRTASFVGMERSALHRKIKSLGIIGNNTREANAM
ncbi:MAG: sigma-54-dependent Fis family transcriptional regulator [Rhizobiales bacterium]|nr:sigma-54-dependent Fis family transcriptional regulator [Hyphomicrobiales bacterium]